MRNRELEALLAARLEPRLGICLLAPTVARKRRKREILSQRLEEGLEMKSRQPWIGRFSS